MTVTGPAILPKFKKIFESDGFKRDARALLAIGDKAFVGLVQRLATTDGICGVTRLREAVRAAGVVDEAQTRLMLRLVPMFARWGRAVAQRTPESFVPTLHEILAHDFSKAERDTLASRLTLLLESAIPGLALADKTEAVSRATGRALRRVQFISDMRPVFDDAREQILGIVPMTTLKLTVESPEQDVPAATWEVRLSEIELLDLSHKISEAQKKLNAMKQLLKDKAVEIAECVMVLGDEGPPPSSP